MSIRAISQKCKCGSVWCKACFTQKHAPAHMATVRRLEWRSVRHVVLSVDRTKFKTGREAWEHVTAHKMIAGLVRNLRRGTKEQNSDSGSWKWKRIKTATGKSIILHPISLTRYKWFVEWHNDGFPHWHILIETVPGPAGRIEGARLRYYWPIARWVREDYVKNRKHWRALTGYVQKNGYFQKKDRAKEGTLQGTLPEWALHMKGLKIRRTGGNIDREVSAEEYFNKKGACEIIDIRTGEVIRRGREKVGRPSDVTEKTYHMRLSCCGTHTRVKIIGRRSFILLQARVGYKEMRRRFKGQYLKGKGYAFRVGKEDLDFIFSRTVRVWDFSIHQEEQGLQARLEAWHKRRIELGYWEYIKAYKLGGI